MTNKELQELLKQWPDNMPVKLAPNINRMLSEQIDLKSGNVSECEEKIWLDSDLKVPHKIKKHILINPIIF